MFDFNSIKRYIVPIYQKVCFIQNDRFAIYLYNGTFGTCVARLSAVLWQLLCMVIFRWFWGPGHSWMRKSCKLCQKYPCSVTVIAQRPNGLQRFPRCHCKDKWQSFLFVYNTLSDKLAHCSAICCWSLNVDFVMLVECCNSAKPPQNI